MKYFISMAWVLLATSLTGCVSTASKLQAPSAIAEVQVLIDTQDFGEKPQIPSVDDIFTLTDEQQASFLSYFNSPDNVYSRPHSRVFKFLENKLSSFSYYGKTFTAQQTLENNTGNCMSLAILTTAYAKLAGVEAEYVESVSNPVYAKALNFEVASGHVVTKLYDPTFIVQKNFLYMQKPHIVVDYFPVNGSWRGPRVNHDRFVSMYYRNLSSDALQQGKPKLAAWLSAEALKYAPEDPANVSLMAVIYRHLKHYDKAETLYQHGLALEKQDLYLLSNYRVLLLKQNRLAAAQAILESMDELDDPSPFRWLSLADQSLQANNMTLALKYYKKTIEKADYLPHGYAGVAKVYYLTGKTELAEKLMREALQRTHDDKAQKLYEAKLAVLAMN